MRNMSVKKLTFTGLMAALICVLTMFPHIPIPAGSGYIHLGDGMILLAFLLGFPANEIVLPLIIMGYLSQSHMAEFSSLAELESLLLQNGWTALTALCMMLFSLLHWPCATTLLTIKKESGSIGWMLLAFFLPLIVSVVVCGSVAAIGRWLLL